MSGADHSGGVASLPDALSLERSRTAPAHRKLRDAFWLAAAATSVAEARRRVLHRLHTWNIAPTTCDTAQLVVSELFTNAVRHTDSERISCELRLSGARLRLEVADQGTGRGVPHPRVVGVDGESGRGLMLVSQLSEDWGVRSNPYGPGHTVWAELAARHQR